MGQSQKDQELNGSEIAVIGMSCRFPGARNPQEFWRNLCEGVESLTQLTREDLKRGGLDPAVLEDPRYVPFVPAVDDIEFFDAGFFGYTPLEAKVMDPQHRLFLECAWEALEQAGHVPEIYRGKIGVFAGAKTNTYLFNLFSNREFFQSLDHFQIALGNDLACMATRVAYKFDLRGPSYAIHTACSTSLVAVHLACQSLLLGECDMALAGGSAINVPQRRGYLYQKGGILSPDGRCRTFDADAQGSNFGNGVGAVLVKRLEDAISDGDHIYAIIRGSASNNDGAQKASFTAPGVEGQMNVLLQAMACAGVEPETISYIEAHGTATDLGDAIEILALTEAFRESSKSKGFCAIGSVKTNIGHLETAAGVAGLIKTALALDHRLIPPSLHFERPNPKINFADSPFYVNTELAEWKAGNTPRRAGVSSFGIGSANAHVILEEAPPTNASGPSRPWQLLLLSARTEAALDAMTANLVRHMQEQPHLGEQYLADVAHTLQVGRKSFPCRRAIVCPAVADANALKDSLDPARAFTQVEGVSNRQVVFLFPGLGDHYLHMGLELYRTESTFREYVDRGAGILQRHLGFDIREVLYPREKTGAGGASTAGASVAGAKLDFRRMVGRSSQQEDEASRHLNQTSFIQPATFVVEYALAQLWMAWGIRPQAMIGYSLGEYVAACLAGVLSFEDALALVAKRARMIQELPQGAMLALPLTESEVAPFLQGSGLSLAAVNGPSMCVLSGPVADVEAVEREMAEREIPSRRLQTSHAFHSSMTEVLAGPLTEFVKTLRLQAPRIPYISNVTGTWITGEEAIDPNYWAKHMSGPVRFSEGIRELVREKGRVLLEVGPGQGLTSFVKQHPDGEAAKLAFATLPGAYDSRPEPAFILETLGKLWLMGQTVDWSAFYSGETRHRVPLPTYPFERQRYWVDPPEAETVNHPRRVTLDKKADISDWFYQPVWKPSPAGQSTARGTASRWLVFSDNQGVGASITEQLREAGHDVVTVAAGESFARIGEREFVINPRRVEDYISLLSTGGGSSFETIVHLWSVSSTDAANDELDSFRQAQDLGFYSLLLLAQAVGRQAFRDRARIEVITSGVHRVTGQEALYPEKATVLGPARVIPQEFPNVACRCIDVVTPKPDANVEQEQAELQMRVALQALAQDLIAEFQAEHDGSMVAYREGERWAQRFEAERLEGRAEQPAMLREKGVYLITGGLGGLGLELAKHLAEKVKARLVLTARNALPDRAEWSDWLKSHGADDDIAERIQSVLQLERLGAEVLTAAADVSNETQMRRVIEDARDRFGAINGVIHLAGIPGGGIIQLKTREMAEQILGPKVKGALVIEKLFENQEIDFLVLYSSIASILGEFGQADYCGANAFLDALAQRNASRHSPRTVVINWDIWQEVGLAVHTEVPPHLIEWRHEMLAKGILNLEGIEAFDRILASGLPQVIVSAQDLPGRIELGKSFTGESFLQELQKAGETKPHALRRVVGTGYIAAASEMEQKIAETWQRVLGAEQIGVNDNFFDLGGNSLLGLQLVSELTRELDLQIAPVTLFEFPTISALARHLNPQAEVIATSSEMAERNKRLRQGTRSSGIAIIGMAGRFPGASDVEQLWTNLCDGTESVTFFSDEELLACGVSRALLNNPHYVKAGSILEGTEKFDAGLFGFSPREAEVMDPQHRIFLECAWEVLDNAGYDPITYQGSVGVFGGSNLSTYLMRLHADPRVRNSVNMLQAILGNDKDSLTTMVSYKLNLRGPSIAVQTFCSTSLVAVHMACQSLRNGECDMALAGGIRVVVPDRQGYLYERGGLAPSDGRTRSFDVKADGSILGNGVGIVCLKRLEDAVADGDHIHAVIKGSAINNDGSLKAGYTAPSVMGQADAILAALDEAGVDPESVSYIEAHGSATELGDPIEVAALTRAFQARTDKKNFCPIGSVKSNFGHLDRAAGVAALIKTALALERRQIPPSINFDSPNPKIDLANSPFYVNTTLAEWEANGEPRRACVNSLGMGGTNAHLILEEAPPLRPSSESRPWQLLLLSARTEAALDSATERLADYIERHADLNLADVAHTLQVGRQGLEFRRMLVCKNLDDARNILAERDAKWMLSAYKEEGERDVIFMFPGLGGQYVNMGRGLYDAEPTFRKVVDGCCEILIPLLGFDLRKELYPEAPPAQSNGAKTAAPASSIDLRKMLGRQESKEDTGAINRTGMSQPLLFVIEYALARLWVEWGIRPKAMVGYSLGEYVAACLAGVFSLEDALKLVAERARLIESLPAGSLLAVGLSEDHIAPLLGQELSIMAVNGPEQCVVSGPPEAIAALQTELDAMGTAYRRLQASHAFHSKMMEPIFDSVVALAQSVKLSPPQIAYLSNVTGTWIKADEATDPVYWARHMCEPVRFSEGVEELLKNRRGVLLEVGPPLLSSIILQHPAASGERQPVTLNLMRHSYETQPDVAYTLQALGKLWLSGVQPDWAGFYSHERRHRVLLPAYPFQRERYWIDAQVDRQYVGQEMADDTSQTEWFYLPSWRRVPAVSSAMDSSAENGSGRWWVFVDEGGMGNLLAESLERDGRSVIRLRAGTGFAQTGVTSFTVSPESLEDYLSVLRVEGEIPAAIVYLWGLVADDESHAEDMDSTTWKEQGERSLFTLSQALEAHGSSDSLPVWIVSDRAHEVIGEEALQPSQVSLLGACAALAKESHNLLIRNLDVDLHSHKTLKYKRLVKQLLDEILNGASEHVIAFRNGHRWVPTLAVAGAEATNGRKTVSDDMSGAVRNYVVINGLGSLGFPFSEHLAHAAGNRIVMVEPHGFPARDLWDEWLANDSGEGLVAARIRRIREIEEHAETLLIETDLSNKNQVRSLLAQASEQFGPLHGILYVCDDEPTSLTVDSPAPGGLLKEKIQGLLVLDEALRDYELSFRLLISNTRTTRALSAADCALTLIFDTFASNSARDGQAHWTSATWDLAPSMGDGFTSSHAIDRLLNLRATPQVIVSPEPLVDGWNKVKALMEDPRARLASEPVAHYPRPSLRVDYVPPRNQTEETIAQIWGELLGVDKIGVHDNFLQLGGDSLLAVRLISRMRDAFHQDLPIRLIFEASTIADLAKSVEPAGEAGEDSEIAEMMKLLEELSDEDVEQELLKRKQAANPEASA
jgi:acyl transferase domain-containing protein/acyl carrier protein